MVGGEIPVVINNGFGGVILHEACVHGLEATSVAKGMSVFCGKIGQRVASEIVNAVDTGTDENAWGSLNVDDEGTPVHGEIKIIGYIVRNHNWNTLFLTYGPSGIKVKLNNYELMTISDISINNNVDYKIYLGCYINNLYEPIEHLNGKLEMFGYSSFVLTEDEMETILEDGGLYGISKKFDTSSRLIEKIISTPVNTLSMKYRYMENEKLNPYITSEVLPTNEEIIYEYDNMGNVVKVLTTAIDLDENQETSFFKMGIEYKYDIFNRLELETHYSSPNKKIKEIKYEYDEFGNIVYKTLRLFEYDENGNENIEQIKHKYCYGNNKLTSILKEIPLEEEMSYENVCSIEYDNMYPKKITKNNIDSELEWEGKKLIRYGNIEFEYNEEGQRIKKITSDSIFEYIYANGNLIRTVSYAKLTPNSKTMIDYNYDETGQVIGLSYNNKQYFYLRDILGNINKIIDKNGNVMVSYSYDGYGNHISTAEGSIETFLLNNNIFLYKGYYYDVETNLFLVSSRYYSPELCRWISPDDIEYLDPESVNGLNLYCYCLNNPIMYVDPTGHFAISTFLIGLAVTSLVSLGLSEIFGSQIVGGASSIANGAGAIKTGISLCYLGPWGIVAGVALIVIGGATIAFGANEIVDGVTGTNYIQDWTGMSDGWYAGLYTGLNIASSVGTIAGNMHLNRIRTNALNGLDDATYGPKAAEHIGDRSYYNSKLTQQEIIKGGQIRKAKYGVRGYEFRIKGYTVMGKSGNIHTGTWSLVYGDGTIWHFLLK